MPKISSITKEKVLNAGVNLIRSSNEVSARNLAAVLNCSTQPIYKLFSSMTQLKQELLAFIQLLHKEKIEYYINNSNYPKYKAFGMGFIKFAKEERALFSYLFMENNSSPYDETLKDYYGEIHNLIAANFKIPLEKARQFHLDMSIYSFGLAMIIFTGAKLTEEEISNRLKAEFFALKKLYLEE